MSDRESYEGEPVAEVTKGVQVWVTPAEADDTIWVVSPENEDRVEVRVRPSYANKTVEIWVAPSETASEVRLWVSPAESDEQ